jgi:hypothetical protein
MTIPFPAIGSKAEAASENRISGTMSVTNPLKILVGADEGYLMLASMFIFAIPWVA